MTQVLSAHCLVFLSKRFEILTGFASPILKIIHDNLQIGNSHVTGFDMVVAEVFSLVGRIHESEELLSSEFIHGIIRFLCNPLVEGLLLFFRSVGARYQAIHPRRRK